MDNQFLFSGLSKEEGLELLLNCKWKDEKTDMQSIRVCKPTGKMEVHQTTFYYRFMKKWKNCLAELLFFSMEGEVPLKFDKEIGLFEYGGGAVTHPEIKLSGIQSEISIHPNCQGLKYLREEQRLVENAVLEVMTEIIKKRTLAYYTQKVFPYGVFNNPQ